MGRCGAMSSRFGRRVSGGPGPPAGIALGLPRQVFERRADGGETAAERPGIDGVIVLRTVGVRRDLRGGAEQRNPGIERDIDDADAGVAPCCGSVAITRLRQNPARVEQLKRDAALPRAGDDEARRGRRGAQKVSPRCRAPQPRSAAAPPLPPGAARPAPRGGAAGRSVRRSRHGPRPIMPKSTATMRSSGRRLRSMARAQSMLPR